MNVVYEFFHQGLPGSSFKISADASPGQLTFCSGNFVGWVPPESVKEGQLTLAVGRSEGGALEGSFEFDCKEPIRFRDRRTGRVYPLGYYRLGHAAEVSLPPDAFALAIDQHRQLSLTLASIKLHRDPVELVLSPSQSVGVGVSPEAELQFSCDPRELIAAYAAAFQALQGIRDIGQRLVLANAWFESVVLQGINKELQAAIHAGKIPADSVAAVDAVMAQQLRNSLPKVSSGSDGGFGHTIATAGKVSAIVALIPIVAVVAIVQAIDGSKFQIAAVDHSIPALSSPYVPPGVLSASRVGTLNAARLKRAPFPRSEIASVTHQVFPAPVTTIARPLAVDKVALRPRAHVVVVAGLLPDHRKHKILLVLWGPGYRAERTVWASAGIATARITLPAHMVPGAWSIAYQDLSGVRLVNHKLTGKAQDRIGIYTIHRPSHKHNRSVVNPRTG